jgi:hypothetical protein
MPFIKDLDSPIVNARTCSAGGGRGAFEPRTSRDSRLSGEGDERGDVRTTLRRVLAISCRITR